MSFDYTEIDYQLLYVCIILPGSEFLVFLQEPGR